MLTTAASVRTFTDALVDRIKPLTPKLLAANLAAESDPVRALLLLLQSASGAVELTGGTAKEIEDLRNALAGINPLIIGLGNEADSTINEYEPLPADLPKYLPAVVMSAVQRTVKPAMTAIGDLEVQIEPLATVIETLRVAPRVVKQIATADVPPPTSIDVDALCAKDTTIALQTIHPRGDGDIITLQAWLYEFTDPNAPSQRRLIEPPTHGSRSASLAGPPAPAWVWLT